MNNKDVERQIYKEFEERKPELFQEILKHTPKMTQQSKPSIWDLFQAFLTKRRAGLSLAIMTTILIVAVVIYNPFGPSSPVAFSTIAIDVNPSIVLELDEEDKVIDVQKNNADADTIIGNMDLIGVDSNVAINALIGSMVANGFINEFTNSVLLSVQSNDTIHEGELKNTLSSTIRNLLSGTAINGSVITQSLDFNEEASTIAQTYDISLAKAKLILDITLIDPTVSINALALLSINDLNLLLDAKNYTLENVTKSGSASQRELLTSQEVFDLVLQHLNIEEATILNYDMELEQEEGIMVYEVEIETATYEYDVLIHAKNGTVIEENSELIDSEDDTSDYPDNILEVSTLKALIITELNLNETLIYEWNIDFEIKNNIAIFHIEIDYNDTEITLEINAFDGTIYSNTYDPDGFHYQDDDE